MWDAVRALGLASAALAAALAPPPAPPASPQVSFKEGRLSLDVKDRPLDWVLDQIADAAGLAVVIDAGLDGRRVTLRARDLAVDEALRLLLREHDVFYFHAGAGKGPSALVAVWVYRQGAGQGLEPIPPEQWASTRELERKLRDADGEVRARALATLVERRPEGARKEILRALKDEDDRVRSRALYGALTSDLELAASTLKAALLDPSPQVRFLALEALVGRPEAAEAARHALNDPDPHVQEKAREILAPVEGPDGGGMR